MEPFTEDSTDVMVPSMNTPFLTLAEASAKTGRSQSTVRRLIHSITHDAHHPDREAVLPSHTEATALKKKGENFTWRIREDIIDREFGSAPSKKEKVQSTISSELVQVVQQELEMKNKQIEKQWEVIASLNERLREGNILMASLQKRLALPEAPNGAPVVEASQSEASTKPSTVAAKEASKKAKKKLLTWLWRGVEVEASAK